MGAMREGKLHVYGMAFHLPLVMRLTTRHEHQRLSGLANGRGVRESLDLDLCP